MVSRGLSGRRALLAVAVVAMGPAGGRAQEADSVAADPREAAVRELIERYFLTWSAQDIDRYGQCFVPQAVIQLIDPQGRVATMPLRRFLDGQRQAQRTSPNRMVETPESIDVRFEGRLARVVVFWKLVDGDREEFGYDHFTLMLADGQWRIANLIFYATPKDEAP